jgi:methylated-DNA-[protein]-cysteine S-methyltransferase
MTYYQWFESPLGPLLLTSDGQSLTGLYLQGQKYFPSLGPTWQEQPQVSPFPQAQEQLAAYFAGQRHNFDLPLNAQGTDFQQRVWQGLGQIPFGETRSYQALAKLIGQPQAVRAVGAANGRNPIAIIVPCHRVIARNGQLTGYAGGLDRKRWLLHHERAAIATDSPSPPTQLELLSTGKQSLPPVESLVDWSIYPGKER